MKHTSLVFIKLGKLPEFIPNYKCILGRMSYVNTVIIDHIRHSGSVKVLFKAFDINYSDFSYVFEKKNADWLPEHRAYDCWIDLQVGTSLPFGPYRLSKPELESLHTYLDENFKNGFIQPSKSSSGAPTLFVKKKDVSLWLCVNYQGLNRMTRHNHYFLLLILELLDCLQTRKVFSKIDLRGAYNLSAHQAWGWMENDILNAMWPFWI